MSELSLLVVGIGAFIASNIDDTFILILLFSTPGILARYVIIGQFVGILLLVLISSLATLLALAIPQFAIGLMGLIPIIIGIKRLLEFRKTSETNRAIKENIYLFSP